MSNVLAMIKSFPATSDINPDLLAAAIEQALACSQTCTACADACLGDGMLDCIRVDNDCADTCATTARVLSRQSGHNTAVIRAQLEVCIAACRSCGDECERHADMHEHCRICAEVCRACESACRELLASMS
ncbi:hypothetical protein Kisp01_66350 [Kineosporia sp. NBRC 101677]|uniref:hypothetical protein n=1 Tax=Kineosporia sp. NBRC 101677 TaxID=3032197 RepID=UPI0024A24A0F|nr:hypothetical protein [Kineosporia sp. NBRC 101677]GLY19621.1 hypothetical protein Kisp01_66350 [Kineosporia sp. NBRC 101677]